MVQISSQKNEEGARATFKELQIRYPKILGGYDVNVQRATWATGASSIARAWVRSRRPMRSGCATT